MNTDSKEKISNYQTLSDLVYNWLKEQIMKAKYKPGEKLSQDAISKELGISRMPVRDALRRLHSEGLVLMKPNCGTVVNKLNKEEVHKIYELRIVLEGMAVRVATAKMDKENIIELTRIIELMKENFNNPVEFMKYNREFHFKLYCHCDNDHLVGMIKSLWDITEPYRLAYISIPGRKDDAIKEHQMIIDSILKGDAYEAERIIQNHQKAVETDLVGMISNSSIYD